MPAKLRMIITDPQNKVADREVTISNQEWNMLVKAFDGWPKRGVNPNPNFDPKLPESETNVKFLDKVDDRWHIADKTQEHFQRLFRSVTERSEKVKAQQNIKSKTDAALAAMTINDTGDVQ